MTHVPGNAESTDRAASTLHAARQDQLDLLHRHAELLTRRYHAVINRHPANGRRPDEPHRAAVVTARVEVLAFVADPLSAQAHGDLSDALERGVRVRMVCTPAVLGVPGQLAALHRPDLARIRWRVAPAVPVAVLVVDQRLAVLPAAGTSDAIVDSGPYARLCVTLFEAMWSRAPAPATDGIGVAADSTRALVSVLSCGLDDDAAAAALGVSRRTVERRVADLMARTGARTRFQVGYRLGLDNAAGLTCSKP